MKYIMLIYVNEKEMQAASKSDADQFLAAFGAYTQSMKSAGVMAGAERLRPSEVASTVTVKNGQSKINDGPYSDTKEQLAGYYVIDVPNLDAALSWASRCPGAARGAVEVRPVLPMS